MKTPDVYEIIRKNIGWFDTSNYNDDDRHLRSNHNKQVVGVMKDEYPNDIITSFCGLRPKMYSLLTVNNFDKAVAKGIAKSYAKKHLRHESYLETLKKKTITKATYRNFQSKKHKVYTVELTKVALSAFDSKRFILSCGIKSVPYGHYKIGRSYF